MKQLFPFLILLSLFSVSAIAQETLSLEAGLSLTGRTAYKMLDGQPDPDKSFETTTVAINYNTPYFDLVLDGSLIGDYKYDGGDEQEYLYGRYFFMNAGYTDLFLGPFTVRAGRSTHRDQVQSPYSLFISSEDLPAMLVDVRYEGEMFFYETRWVSLNEDSRGTYTGITLPEVEWVDRGMNYKVFGINAGDWRFGFQDSIVYLHQEFDPEYFFSPIPMYLAQIITANPGRPWGEWGNAKSLMGFFAERETESDYALAQLLIDDVNGSFIPGIDVGNLTKIAWSLGGRKETSLGTFGFYHAGATKYTFQATYAGTVPTDMPEAVDVPYNYLPYEYTYYPVSTYELDSGDLMPLHYQDNSIGYKYGENNISFLLDWQNRFFEGESLQFDIYSNLEWVLNGAKAPNNPWHEGDDVSVTSDPVQLLDGTVEHIVRSTTRLAKPVGPFTLTMDLTLGYIFNAMKLEEGVPNEAYIFYPQAGVHEPLLIATIGGVWKLESSSLK